jgi:hypothetical protein
MTRDKFPRRKVFSAHLWDLVGGQLSSNCHPTPTDPTIPSGTVLPAVVNFAPLLFEWNRIRGSLYPDEDVLKTSYTT